MSRFLFLCAWLLVGLLPESGWSQQTPPGGAAEALGQQGDAFFDRRQYQEAIAAYQKLLQAYPNSEVVTGTRFHLAYALYLTGQFGPATDELHRLIGAPTTPPDVQEQAALLLPQVLAQQAGGQGADSPGRRAGFEDAVREFTAFIDKFPRSADLEAASYGRAVANYQLGRYAEAVQDLRRNVQSFPASDTVQDSAFLLALTTATQANLALNQPGHPPAQTDAALRGYAEAEKLLGDLIARRTDLSLVNEAQFQLGETLLAHAAASPEAARRALYGRALAAYRAVEPKDVVVAAQAARVRGIAEARVAELRKGAGADLGAARRLDARRLVEQGRLEEIQAKDDPVLTARIKGGAVYCNLGRYDEARVLMNTLGPSIRKPEDEKLALYYVALSYVGQGLVDKAVAAYDRFQAKFAGDPVAENLPLLVGNLFLNGEKPDPARANKYYDELARLYPKSHLRETALLQGAAASAALGRYDEALGTLDRFLAGKPGRELAAAGALARAKVQKDAKDYDGALAAFRKVRDDDKDLPEGEEAAYWVGATLLQKKDAAGAVAELKRFVDARPQGRLTPAALLTLAQAQAATGAKDQAQATLADVPKRFPDAPEAAGAVFASANLFLADRRYDDVVRELAAFVDQHPDAEQAPAAVGQIAAVQGQQKQFDAAAATYEGFLARQPDSPEAPELLGKLAALWRRAAQGMGAYVVLGAGQRDAWKADVDKSIAASERQLEHYPDAPATALGTQNLAECQRLLVEAKLQTAGGMEDYFRKLADRYKAQPAVQSRLLFRLAALLAEADPAKALAEMKGAYQANVVYSPADLDLYASALLPKEPDAAAAVFAKAAEDYPLPPGTSPAQAPADVQQAQALALYGRGTLAARRGDAAGAAAAFTELRRLYPRSSKVPEASLGLAETLVAAGKDAEALPLLAEVARSTTSPLAARARSLFLNGEIQARKGSVEAADAYLKVAAFYPASPEAPEGLWKGAQALEGQAATLGDAPAKPGAPTKGSQLARARKAYADLVSNYPESKWTTQAKVRLAALPEAKS